MNFTGNYHEGNTRHGRMEGHGRYMFNGGNIYEGNFKDGMFHGKGVTHFPNGGQFHAIWNEGKLVQGKYFFKDGLNYEKENWEYCVAEGTNIDRRFYHEIVKQEGERENNYLQSLSIGDVEGDTTITSNNSGKMRIMETNFKDDDDSRGILQEDNVINNDDSKNDDDGDGDAN